MGVFPIRNNYYEPQFDFREMVKPLSSDRFLPGVNFNVKGQLEFISKFSFTHEKIDIPKNSFKEGDAEYWYQIIRMLKPKKIIEIGSGYSTIIAVEAIESNLKNEIGYVCEHVCIEPFERSWLESYDVSVIRRKVEDIELNFFQNLEENDILFIDSSHIIRPQGDVIYEYLEILPTLKKGVIVHIHDIFSPKNYPEKWIKDEVRFWNEQYLLEAFLSGNDCWRVVGGLNYLYHNYYDQLKRVAPSITINMDQEPSSFYIKKVCD